MVSVLSGMKLSFDHLSRSYAHDTIIVFCNSSDLLFTSGNVQSSTLVFSSSLLRNPYLARNGVDVALVITVSPENSSNHSVAVKSLS